jgi:hypothetical protein
MRAMLDEHRRLPSLTTLWGERDAKIGLFQLSGEAMPRGTEGPYYVRERSEHTFQCRFFNLAELVSSRRLQRRPYR